MGTISWVLLLLVGGLSPLTTTAHVCDSKNVDELVCDPGTNGAKFFTCGGPGGTHYLQDCPSGLRFNNAVNVCDWSQNAPDCVDDDQSSTTTTTPTSTSSTTSTTTTSTTTTPTTTTPTSTSSTTSTTTPTTTTPTSTSSTTATTTTSTTTPTTTTASSCNSNNCQLPDCRCISTDIPGNLTLSDVPQMILLTFDDGINVNNFHYYDGLFPEDEQQALKNPNHCRTAATFFVSNDYTDMAMVKKLWNRHNEVASHSLTHGYPSTWDSAKWEEEMQGMRQALATAVGANVSQIHGMRVPFLELGGETQFAMMQNNHITYDSSMFGGSLDGSNTDHPVWPFSLLYPPTDAVCVHWNCPTGSYPEVWEVPIIRQYNLQGQACSMTDSCTFPAGASAENVTAFLRHNFQRHYSTNRAPFMISLHATWFHNVPASLDGLKAFLNETNADTDVWQVTVTQMLDWVRHPLPLDRVTELDSWNQCA